MDFLYLVSPERNSIRFIVGIGEYVYQRTSHRKLSGGRYEIHPFESCVAENGYYRFEIYFVSFRKFQDASLYGLTGRYFFLKGGRITYYEASLFSAFQYFRYGARTLDAEGRFIIASFQAFTRMGKEENIVRALKRIKVRTAVFRRFLIRKDNKVERLFCGLAQYEPACG